MEEFKASLLPQGFNVNNYTLHQTSVVSISSPNVWNFLSQVWEVCTLWNVLFMLLLITNLKCVPFIWHMRILNGCTRTLKIQRPKASPTYAQIFQPLITTTQVPMMEIDFNMHKTNSSYFADVDIARAHLVCTLFSKGIEHCRGGTGAYTGSNLPIFSCALGAVTCTFKRELKAYQSYELWTRVLSWDEKWIYIITHFVRKGAVKPKDFSLYPEQNPSAEELSEAEGEKLAERQMNKDKLSGHPGVVATALSKCVFKSGRRTVAPAFMFKKSGILPPLSKTKLSSSKMHCPESNSTGSESELFSDSCKSSDSGIAICNEEEESAMNQVEKERARGMEIAQCLSGKAQSALESEFTGDEEPVLGRHLDGIGLGGIARCAGILALHLLKPRSSLDEKLVDPVSCIGRESTQSDSDSS
ncbi:hypothetical protein K3495_g3380 [Podosphaera aphanis]|nr:hypothetical protein K3495_g3380 [Podosphaera aphanis]